MYSHTRLLQVRSELMKKEWVWYGVLLIWLVSCGRTPTSTLVPFDMMTPGTHEQTLALTDGSLIRYTIIIPDGYTGSEAVPLIMALHYGGQVTPYYGRDFLELLIKPALGDLGAIIVAPDSRHGPWASEKGEADVLVLLDHLVAAYNIDTERTLLTGYSLGGMGTWYIVGRHQGRFAAALPIAAYPQPDSTTIPWTIPLYIIHSRADELIPLQMSLDAAATLEAQGVDVQMVVLEGVSHYETYRFVEPLHKAIPWINSVWNGER